MSKYDIGFIQTILPRTLARRCRKTGKVEFRLWKAGHWRSPKEDFWTAYDPSYWKDFIKVHPLCIKTLFTRD